MSKIAFKLTMGTETDFQKSVRKTWAFMPATKSFKSKRDYDRHTNKKMIERNIKMGLCD